LGSSSRVILNGRHINLERAELVMVNVWMDKYTAKQASTACGKIRENVGLG